MNTIETIKKSKLEQERKTNKLVLIAAGLIFSFVVTCFVLHSIGIIHLS